MKIDRHDGRVVLRRTAGSPAAVEAWFLTSLLALCGASIAAFAVGPTTFFAAILTVFSAVGAMALGLATMNERATTGGRLVPVRRFIEVAPAQDSAGYRDAPDEPALLVDGKTRIPQRELREVVVGHAVNHSGGGGEHHFWPVFLVSSERVVTVGIYRDQAEALRAGRRLAEMFYLPRREAETGLVGHGVGQGFLLGALTIGLSLAAIGGGSWLLVGLGLATAPALIAFALWLFMKFAAEWSRGRLRPLIDAEVARTFKLEPKVRVASVEPSFPPEADEHEVEVASSSPTNHESPARRETDHEQ